MSHFPVIGLNLSLVNFIILCYLETLPTSLVILHLGCLGVYQKAVYFYCCVVNVSFVKYTDFNFMI